MTIDRRLRSGEAPRRTMLAIWAATSLTAVLFALPWPIGNAPVDGAFALRLATGCAALGLAMYALAIAAWRLLGREACLASCVLFAMNPVLLTAFLPPVPIATGAALAAIAAALWSLSQRSAVRGAMGAGAALALGFILQPLTWPIALAVAGVLFVRWLVQHDAADAFAGLVQGFAVLAAAGLTVSWIGGWSYGAAPVGAVAALAIVLGGTSALRRMSHITPALLGGSMLAITGTAAAAAWLLPGCSSIGGGTAALTERETLLAPTWTLVSGLIALGAAAYLWRSNQAWLRSWWGCYALLLATATLGILVAPALAPATALLATVPLGWLAAQLLFGRRKAHRGRRAWRVAALGAAGLSGGVLSAVAQADAPPLQVAALLGITAPLSPQD